MVNTEDQLPIRYAMNKEDQCQHCCALCERQQCAASKEDPHELHLCETCLDKLRTGLSKEQELRANASSSSWQAVNSAA